MKRVTLVSLTVCLILAIVSGISASTLAETASETITKAEQHFEKANELLNRKEYKAAVAEFEEVMNISPNSKIAQDAQYWMGQSHFMAGQFDAAQATFAKLIEQYPASAIVPATKLMVEHVGRAKDIQEKKRAIAEARMRLAALQRDIGNPELTIRRIWGASGTKKELRHENYYLYGVVRDDNIARPSPNGRYIAYVNWGPPSIAVYDLTTGESRDITHEGTWDASPTGEEFGWNPIWSPDGRYVAYQWCIYGTKADNLKDHNEIRIAGLDGSRPRVIYRTETENNNREITPYDWSPDGKTILATIGPSSPNLGSLKQSAKDKSSHMVLISVEDGSRRILTSFEKMHWRAIQMFFSPDGRYIAYNSEDASNRKIGRRIYLLRTDGSGDPIPLDTHTRSADDSLLGWAPDGKWLLFSTYRTGDRFMAFIEVHEGQSQGAAQFVRRIDEGFKPIGFSRNGSYHYGVNKKPLDVYTATLDPETGKEVVPLAKAIWSFEGFNSSPAWSPDGKNLAYVSRRPSPESSRHRRVLVIRSVETGQERELILKLPAAAFHPRWSRDGRSILCAVSTGAMLSSKHSPCHLSLIDAQTGDATFIVPHDSNTLLSHWEWSTDGKEVFYIRRGGDKPRRIMMYNLETDKEKELYREGVGRQGLDVSPDGRQLLFAKDDKILMVIAVEDGEPRELLRLQDTESIRGIAWTPDGRYVLFVKRGSGQLELWRVPAEGGEPQTLLAKELKGLGDLEDISVHPDGRQVAFDVTRENQELWVMENFLPESTTSK